MKKSILTILSLLFVIICNAQIDTSSADYKKGTYILEQTNQEIKSENGKIGSIDYWNLALGTALTEQDKEKTYQYLLKSQQLDNAGFFENTEYLIRYYVNDIENTDFYKLLGQKFTDLINTSKNQLTDNENPTESKVENIENQEVVDILVEMLNRDKKYRKDKGFLLSKDLQNKQTKLDSINRKELIKLFDKYGYVGKSITGDNQYKNYVCLIVEHGQSLTDQRKWLPVIAKAYKNDELNANPLKMLLDRVHWKETKKQYFGSHTGVPFESDEEIKRIKLMYGIE
ncbi:MAG: hypothetical protein WBF67_05815 [Olleya sp.]